MNERRAGGLGGERHRLGALGLHRVETLPAALEQDADQVDDDVGVAHRRRDRLRIAQIGLHRVDLPDPAHRPQIAGKLRPAHRDADAVLPLRQRPHHVAAEEARATEHGDEGFELAFCGHRRRKYRIAGTAV